MMGDEKAQLVAEYWVVSVKLSSTKSRISHPKNLLETSLTELL